MSMTRDKLIFPSAITQFLRHFPISYPESPHFTFMYAIDEATFRRSAAQLRPRQPRIKTAAPLAFIAPLSSVGGVTLEAIMAQLVHMDACLDTLNDELCQVNTHVSHIARRQAVMGGFTMASSPSPEAFEDESDDDSSNDDTDEDDDASSPSDDEMST